jgi:uncharacterized protein YhbP (UPF0306 family)
MNDAETLRASARAYLAAQHTLTLATCGPDGPWAATLFYAEDGFTLYVVSDPATRHGQHVAANPNVAATISAAERDWRAIKGIQLEGRCDPVRDAAEARRAREVYLRKFPFAAPFLDDPDRIGAAVARKTRAVVFYAIRPRRLLFLDNARGFGDRREVSLAEPSPPGRS